MTTTGANEPEASSRNGIKQLPRRSQARKAACLHDPLLIVLAAAYAAAGANEPSWRHAGREHAPVVAFFRLRSRPKRRLRLFPGNGLSL